MSRNRIVHDAHERSLGRTLQAHADEVGRHLIEVGKALGAVGKAERNTMTPQEREEYPALPALPPDPGS